MGSWDPLERTTALNIRCAGIADSCRERPFSPSPQLNVGHQRRQGSDSSSPISPNTVRRISTQTVLPTAPPLAPTGPSAPSPMTNSLDADAPNLSLETKSMTGLADPSRGNHQNKRIKRLQALSPSPGPIDHHQPSEPQPSTSSSSGLTELRQDSITLMRATERPDSVVPTQAEALTDARSPLKTVMPVLDAIAKKKTRQHLPPSRTRSQRPSNPTKSESSPFESPPKWRPRSVRRPNPRLVRSIPMLGHGSSATKGIDTKVRLAPKALSGRGDVAKKTLQEGKIEREPGGQEERLEL